MRPKYCSMPVALRMRAPIKSGRTTTTRRLLATYIIPACACPSRSTSTCSNNPLARAPPAAAAPCNSNSDSGQTIRTPRTALSRYRAMGPDKTWSVSELPLPTLLPAKTSTEWTEGANIPNKLSVAGGLRMSTKPGPPGLCLPAVRRSRSPCCIRCPMWRGRARHPRCTLWPDS